MGLFIFIFLLFYYFIFQIMVLIIDFSCFILFIRKLHQVHFVFLLIVLGYQSLLYASFLFSSRHLISIAGKEFTSHGVTNLSYFVASLVLSLVFIFGSEIY